MTDYVSWTPDLSVFVEEIDDQHRELFKRLNGFLEAVINGDGKQELGGVLKFLIDYCIVHFGTEELYMQKHKFPAYAAHKAAHERLTNAVLHVQEHVQEGVTSEHVITLVNQLGAWVADHIQKMDKKLGAYLAVIQKAPASLTAGDESRGPWARGGGRPANLAEAECGYREACSAIFDKFRDPDSRYFWSARYCMAPSAGECERRKLMDGGVQPSEVAITLLPDGQHLATLAY